MDDFDHIIMEIGSKGDLSASTRRECATAFKLVRRKYPNAKVLIVVGGYDDDPREIYDIPEAAEYIRKWAADAGLADWRDAARVPWIDNLGLGILQMCGAFAADSPIRVNTPAGVRGGSA